MILLHIYDVDISQPLLPTVLQPMMVTGDKLANRIGVRLKNGAQPYTPDGSCRGYVLRADGATVPILNGVVNGNEMYIDLPEAAYAVQGSVVISIVCVTSTAVTTVFLGSGSVNRSQTDVVIDPGTVIDDISTLIQEIETAVASIPEDYSTLSRMVDALTHFDLSISGKYIASTGVETANSDYSCTDYIPVNSDSVLILDGFWTGTGAYAYMFYTAAKEKISGANSITSRTVVTTIPSTAAYVRFSSRTSQGETPVAYVSNHVVEDVADLMPRMATAEGDITDLKSAITGMTTASASDEGKVLKAKTVTDGTVTEWEFGSGTEPIITGVSYDDDDVVAYSSTNGSSGANQTAVVIAPNVTTGYFVKSAAVYAAEGTNIKFSVFKIAPYYNVPDALNRKKFTKVYDLAVIPAGEDGKAEIVFDVPLYLVGGDTVLVAACNESTLNKRMKYGAYKDALYTIFEYDRSWYDLKPGEYYDFAYPYKTSENNPTYDIVYVAESNVTTETFAADQILQQRENMNPFDRKIDEHSNNAVQNSALYNELNIVKTETIIPTDTTWKNSEAVQPQGYNGWFTVAYVDETDAVKLKKLDIFATTGASVKLGIWTYRPHGVGAVQGYLTLKSVLGTVTAADSHAVFNLDSVDFDPATEFLGIAASSGAIGWNGNIVNGFVGEWFNSDKGFYDTAVGAENSMLMNAPGKTESTSGTVQGNYTITYQLAESKTVTTVTNVKNAVDGMLADVEELKTSTPVVDAPLRTPHNKYFCVLVDDLTRGALDIADRLLAIGVKPAFGLKMETLGSDITWDEMKKLQDMGFEIAFHGMLHSHTPAGTAPANDAVMIADIAAFKALCDEHGIILHGYLGPNHYPLPVGAFKEFEWARSPYGLDAYGSTSHLATTFASVVIWSCDPVDGAIQKANMIAAASSVGDNQYLTPMCHTSNLVAYLDDYLDVFNSWIEAGLVPLRPMDAVKQSLFNAGGIGNNSTFEIQAGTATNPYYLIAGNGTILHNP